MSRISLFRGARAVGVAAAMLAASCLFSPADAQTARTAAAANRRTDSAAAASQKNDAGAGPPNQKNDPAGQTVPSGGARPQNNSAAASSTGQAPVASANQAASGDPLPAGRVIYAELMQNVDVRKAKPGDRVFARTTLAVLAHGKVLIAEGARITGHVTEAKARSKDDAESVLGIVFDHVETVDSTELPLETTIQAIGIGELRAGSAIKVADDAGYSPAPGPFSIETGTRSRRDDDKELPKAETSPALDIGSKGVIGVKAMELMEAKDATHGSLVISLEKNVKLDNRWQLVLRVIAPKVSSTKTDEK